MLRLRSFSIMEDCMLTTQDLALLLRDSNNDEEEDSVMSESEKN